MCERMEATTSSSNVLDLQLLIDRWEMLLSRLQDNPKAARMMNSKMGQYLSSHPFVALSVVLFSALAAVPCGLFLTFALVTIIMCAVGFVFFEAFLLFVGGLALLCVVSGIAVFSVTVSVIINAMYITSSGVLKHYNKTKGASNRERQSGDESPTSPKEL